MEHAKIKRAKSRIDGSVRLASVLLSPLNHAITAERCLASPLGFQTSPIAPVGGPKCQEWVVCHERRVSCLRRATVREMKEGPSSSVIRSRSQATASSCGQKPWWGALGKRRDNISAGTVERGKHKRTAAERAPPDYPLSQHPPVPSSQISSATSPQH